MDPHKFRNLVRNVSGKEISSEQATQFLELFKAEFEEAHNTATRSFIALHFGTKTDNS